MWRSSGSCGQSSPWMPARTLPSWRASFGRACANCSSRKILRAMVSPSTRCMMKPVPSSSCGCSTCSTRGDGTPASWASCISDRLGVQPGRARRRRAITRRRAAQDRADIAVGMHDIERPGLLAGAAGEPGRAGDAGRARTPRGDAASEQRLHHLPLNFAGRFSRNAVTPSLKSSAAPAIRCDSNSRLS